jgi:hypothetical protein
MPMSMMTGSISTASIYSAPWRKAAAISFPVPEPKINTVSAPGCARYGRSYVRSAE